MSQGTTKQVLSRKLFGMAQKLRLNQDVLGTRKYRRGGRQLEVELKLFKK